MIRVMALVIVTIAIFELLNTTYCLYLILLKIRAKITDSCSCVSQYFIMLTLTLILVMSELLIV